MQRTGRKTVSKDKLESTIGAVAELEQINEVGKVIELLS